MGIPWDGAGMNCYVMGQQRWAWIRTEANFGRIRTGSDCRFFENWHIRTGSDWENFCCFHV